MSETYDLIYCEDRTEYNEYQRQLKEAFPDCTFEDASDYVHAYRFAIKRYIPFDDDYYMTLIDLGITASLNIQFALMDGSGTIGRVLDKMKARDKRE